LEKSKHIGDAFKVLIVKTRPSQLKYYNTYQFWQGNQIDDESTVGGGWMVSRSSGDVISSVVVEVLDAAGARRSPVSVKIASQQNLCAAYTSSSMFDV
jgi:hypothetical protein